MRIANVIGSVTLSRGHDAMTGLRLIVVVPYSQAGLRAQKPDGEDFIAIDTLGAGLGQDVAISEGVESQMIFYPNKKPIDASCAAILDRINVS